MASKPTTTDVMMLLNQVYVAESIASAALAALEEDPESETMYAAIRYHARQVNQARRAYREAVARLVMQEEPR